MIYDMWVSDFYLDNSLKNGKLVLTYLFEVYWINIESMKLSTIWTPTNYPSLNPTNYKWFDIFILI